MFFGPLDKYKIIKWEKQFGSSYVLVFSENIMHTRMHVILASKKISASMVFILS